DGDKTSVRRANHGKSVFDTSHDCHACVDPVIEHKVASGYAHQADTVLRISANGRWEVHIFADCRCAALSQQAGTVTRHERCLKTGNEMALIVLLNTAFGMKCDRDIGGGGGGWSGLR